MGKATGGQKIDTIFVLIIFSIFAMSVLLVLTLGASMYKNMTETSRDGQAERTLLSFIWTKVKNSDEGGIVYVGEFHGQNALCFDEIIGDEEYQTVVYYYDGWVYELFYDKSIELLPSEGERVMEIENLLFEEAEYGLIKVSAGDKSLLISPRTHAHSGQLTIDS